MATDELKRESYSCSLISQGSIKFYSLTMPSEILADTCFVSTRDDDPKEGFQRMLDKNRAQEIADYIDSGKGSIPTAIILSAQKDADLQYNSKNKTIDFNMVPNAFLILDGQHRIYGFSLAKTSVRVPVIIYNGLSRKEETRLFVDINTKQRPVPSELVLDIKSLAEYENNIDSFCRTIYDLFNEQSDSVLLGRMSPAQKASGKISRVTFNSAIKPIYGIFGERDAEEIYNFLNAYLKAMSIGFQKKGIESLVKPTIFKAIMQFFPHVARLTDGIYTVEKFSEALTPLFNAVSPTKVMKATSIKTISDLFLDSLNRGFTL
ncbi:MAG: DGQHR domain-containing protein [Candidatus Fimivivens sp.]|nr:DGQHR domain-containing protein [Candidatus Fimivivens sp.]